MSTIGQKEVNPYEHYGGKGVKIALLDSGVNMYHSHISERLSGVAFRVNRDGWIERHDDVRDYLGHGTAIAALLKYVALESEIVIGKIFDEKLTCYPSVLAHAIDWAVDEGVDIINLSLGMSERFDVVEESCKRAAEAGIVLVAAHDRQSEIVWPAQLDEVYAVEATEIGREQWTFTEHSSIGACGFPRELAEPIQLYNLHGHSFAAAHFTAWVARYFEAENVRGNEYVNRMIKQMKTV